MKWFQHQSMAHTDAKLQKVLIKYGFEGYGLYWYCIESICQNLEPRLTFELEQDSEILAHIGKMDSRLVEEIMLYMVNAGLFSETNGTVICRTLARYLGDNLTRNDNLKGIIKEEKRKVLSQTVSCSLRLSQQEEKRREEKRREEKRREENKKNTAIAVVDAKPVCDSFELFYSQYPKKVGKADALKAWNKLDPDQALISRLINDVQERVKQGAWCTGKGKSYIPGPAPYLNQRKWEDEIIPRPEFKAQVDYSAIAREAQEL